MVRLAFSIATVALASLLAGCAAPLPPRDSMRYSEALPGVPDTSLARMAPADPPNGQAAYQLFERPQAALALRRFLIASAERTLDLQYFIWDADQSGLLLMADLQAAAARGVRIRLLLDDANSSDAEPYLLWLGRLPNVHVRVYNPFPGSRAGIVAKSASALGDLQRVRFRMHNKLLVADNAFAVTGGRNIGDAYLTSRQGNFFDLDLLLAGSVVQELASSFDDYWNSDRAFDLDLLASGVTTPKALPPEDATAPRPLDAKSLRMGVCPARVFVDPEEKSVGTSLEDSSLTVHQRLIQLFTDSKQRILIVSPYFVRGAIGMERIATRRANNIEVQVITNSLATTDELPAHVAYLRYRHKLLRLGVNLHEFAPVATDSNVPEEERQATRLHAKFSVVDKRYAYVGSMNFTSRSEHVNTEVGVILDCPPLAQHLENLVAQLETYHLSLSEGALGIHWIRRHKAGPEEIWNTEPAVSWWDRFKATLLAPFVPEDEI